MNTQKTLFAFKLAEKRAANVDAAAGKWKARDGVAIAGCTGASAAIRYVTYTAVGQDSNTLC